MTRWNPSRSDDDAILWMLQARRDGLSSSEIGARVGRTGPLTRTITNRVRMADLAESGEPHGEVAGGYW